MIEIINKNIFVSIWLFDVEADLAAQQLIKDEVLVTWMMNIKLQQKINFIWNKKKVY